MALGAILRRAFAAVVIVALAMNVVAMVQWRHKPQAASLPGVVRRAPGVVEKRTTWEMLNQQATRAASNTAPPVAMQPPIDVEQPPSVFCAFTDDNSCLNVSQSAGPATCANYATTPVFWPAPETVSIGPSEALLSPSLSVQILLTKPNPDSHALRELIEIVRYHLRGILRQPYTLSSDAAASPCRIDRLVISLKELGLSDVPKGANEDYKLDCSVPQMAIHASQAWGVIRALQTLRHAVRIVDSALHVAGTPLAIADAPRFGYRSFLIDSARNYLPIEFILGLVRLMGAYKLNILHWHLTDDHNFGLELESHPLLSRGQFWNYKKTDIRRVIAEARKVGVRVMPEANPFSHAASWKTGYRHLVPNCPKFACNDAWSLGLNVIRPQTYEFIADVLREIVELFPDPFIHLGGDEPFTGCWEEDKEVQAWLKSRGDAAEVLFVHHQKQMESIYAWLNRTVIMWQEAWYAAPKALHAKAHILWKGPEEWDTWSPGLMRDERAGIIYASSWYFDMTCKTWTDCYTRQPLPGKEHDKLWGLLATAWEVDLETYFELNMLKRLIAVSEIFWSTFAAREKLRSSLSDRMASVCAATDARDALTKDFFATLPKGPINGWSFCADPPATPQRNLQRWIQRQTERDMYVCNLIHYASVGKTADCNTPYCQRNKVNAWWRPSQDAIQEKVKLIVWDEDK